HTGRRQFDRMCHWTTRQSVTVEEKAELIALLKFLRRERKAFGQRVAGAIARAESEDYIWDALPPSTREAFLRESTEVSWLERGLHEGLTEAPFPPIDDDASRGLEK